MSYAWAAQTGEYAQFNYGQYMYIDNARDVTTLVARIAFDNVIWRTTSDGLVLFEADGDLVYNNGDPYRNHYLMFFEVADGKIIRWREYYSPVVWARAVGAPLETLP